MAVVIFFKDENLYNFKYFELKSINQKVKKCKTKINKHEIKYGFESN